MEVTVTIPTAPLGLPRCAPSNHAASLRKHSLQWDVEVPGLSIILINWNSLAYLTDCLKTIYCNPPSLPFEIIVVDNASPEGGLDAFACRFPSVRLLRSTSNLGFARANNLAFRHSRGRFILLLNPDTRVIGSALDCMLEQFQRLPDAGIVGCTLLNSDLTISTTSIQRFPTILNQVLTAECLRLRFPKLPLWSIDPLFSPHPQAVKVDVIPGACMMLKREVFEMVGLLTEDYFMYAEDIDLNYKVSQCGLSSYYIAAAQVVHYGARSSEQHPVSYWSTVMVHRAMFHFFWRSRGVVYAFFYRFAMGIAASVRLIILALMRSFGERETLRFSSDKWAAVLRWSLGAYRRDRR